MHSSQVDLFIEIIQLNFFFDNSIHSSLRSFRGEATSPINELALISSAKFSPGEFSAFFLKAGERKGEGEFLRSSVLNPRPRCEHSLRFNYGTLKVCSAHSINRCETWLCFRTPLLKRFLNRFRTIYSPSNLTVDSRTGAIEIKKIIQYTCIFFQLLIFTKTLRGYFQISQFVGAVWAALT